MEDKLKWKKRALLSHSLNKESLISPKAPQSKQCIIAHIKTAQSQFTESVWQIYHTI